MQNVKPDFQRVDEANKTDHGDHHLLLLHVFVSAMLGITQQQQKGIFFSSEFHHQRPHIPLVRVH